MQNAINTAPLDAPRTRIARKARIHNAMVWLHRYSGLAIMLFIIIAGVTGSILVFRAELDAALNRNLFDAPVAAEMAPPAAIADQVARAHPQWRILNVPLVLTPGRSLPLAVAPATPGTRLGFNQIFVDPHDGHIIGKRMIGPGWDRRHIVEGIYQFHFNLLAGDIGRWFMGGIAIIWFLSNLIGVYLTLPQRSPFWKNWAKIWTIKQGTRFPRFCLDLHRASALWLFIGLLLLSLTSVEMNLYNELFVPAVNAVSTAPKTPFDDSAQVPPNHAAPKVSFVNALRDVMPLAAKDHPGWVPEFASYAPEENLLGVSFIRPGTDIYSALGPIAYFVDGQTGKPVFRDDPYNEGARGVVMRSLYPLHSGRIWGWPTRILVFVLGIAVTILSLAGLYVWWRKR